MEPHAKEPDAQAPGSFHYMVERYCYSIQVWVRRTAPSKPAIIGAEG
jgi:hypothetical protein